GSLIVEGWNNSDVEARLDQVLRTPRGALMTRHRYGVLAVGLTASPRLSVQRHAEKVHGTWAEQHGTIVDGVLAIVGTLDIDLRVRCRHRTHQQSRISARRKRRLQPGQHRQTSDVDIARPPHGEWASLARSLLVSNCVARCAQPADARPAPVNPRPARPCPAL